MVHLHWVANRFVLRANRVLTQTLKERLHVHPVLLATPVMMSQPHQLLVAMAHMLRLVMDDAASAPRASTAQATPLLVCSVPPVSNALLPVPPSCVAKASILGSAMVLALLARWALVALLITGVASLVTPDMSVVTLHAAK